MNINLIFDKAHVKIDEETAAVLAKACCLAEENSTKPGDPNRPTFRALGLTFEAIRAALICQSYLNDTTRAQAQDEIANIVTSNDKLC